MELLKICFGNIYIFILIFWICIWIMIGIINIYKVKFGFYKVRSKSDFYLVI